MLIDFGHEPHVASRSRPRRCSAWVCTRLALWASYRPMARATYRQTAQPPPYIRSLWTTCPRSALAPCCLQAPPASRLQAWTSCRRSDLATVKDHAKFAAMQRTPPETPKKSAPLQHPKENPCLKRRSKKHPKHHVPTPPQPARGKEHPRPKPNLPPFKDSTQCANHMPISAQATTDPNRKPTSPRSAAKTRPAANPNKPSGPKPFRWRSQHGCSR